MLAIRGRSILDNNGIPTFEVEIKTRDGTFKSSVPNQGGKTNIYDGRKIEDFLKKLNEKIGPALIRKKFELGDQRGLDEFLSMEIHPKNFRGCDCPNGIMAISQAFLKASAFAQSLTVAEYLANIASITHYRLPVPYIEIFSRETLDTDEVGIHAIYLIPNKLDSFIQSMWVCSEVVKKMKAILVSRYGPAFSLVNETGSFMPNSMSLEEALNLINEAVQKSGQCGKIKIGFDVKADDFLLPNGRYDFNKKLSKGDSRQTFTSEKLMKVFLRIREKYPVTSLEDPFSQSDCGSWLELQETKKFSIIATKQLEHGSYEKLNKMINKKLCSLVGLKIAWFKTITDLIDYNRECLKANLKTVFIVERSDTEEDIISDLAIGLQCSHVKFGGLMRTEKNMKYNRLMELEKALNGSPSFHRIKECIEI